MMKSFFKKLAFVMALAMVVSMAAPAGSALAAGLSVAYQAGGAVSELNLKAGAEQDLKFLGAPKNWKDLGWSWTSSNEAVATVDAAGVVTAVADGTATITITVGTLSGSVTVNVGDAKAYNVTLGTADNKAMTTAELKEGATLDLNFYGVKDWNKNNYTVAWSVSGDAANVDKNGVVTAAKAGKAVVTASIVNNLTGVAHNVTPVEVTVAGAVNPDSFTVAQKDTDKFVLTFATAKTADAIKENLTVSVKIADQDFPISFENVTVDGTTATVVTYASFENEEVYTLTYGKEKVEHTIVLGDVAKVGVDYYTGKNPDNKFAYVTEEEEDDYVTFVPVLYDKYGNVITAKYNLDNFTFSYEVSSNVAPNCISYDTYAFDNAGTATVTVTAGWVTDNGDFKEVTGTTAVPVLKRGAVGLKLVKAGIAATDGVWSDDDIKDTAKFNDDIFTYYLTPASSFQNDPSSALWSIASTSVMYKTTEDRDFVYTAVFEDNRGNTLTTNGNYDYGTFTYESTNSDVLTVMDGTGIVDVRKVGKTNILVYFEAADGSETKKLVASTAVTVTPETYPVSYKITSAVSTVGSHVVDSALNNGTFKVQFYDQFGNVYRNDELMKYFKLEARDTTVSLNQVSPNGWEELTGPLYTWEGWSGNYVFAIDASEYEDDFEGAKAFNSKTYSFKLSLEECDLTEKIKTPYSVCSLVVKNTEKEYKLLKNFIAATANGTKGIDDFTDADLVKDLKNYKFNLSIGGGNSVDVAVKNVVDYNNTGAQALIKSYWATEIGVTYLSSGNLPVANVPSYLIKDVKEGTDEIKITTGSVGYVYYKVNGPSKTVVAGESVDNDFYSYGTSSNKVVFSFNDSEVVGKYMFKLNGEEIEAKVDTTDNGASADVDPLYWVGKGNFYIELNGEMKAIYDKDGGYGGMNPGNVKEGETYYYTMWEDKNVWYPIEFVEKEVISADFNYAGTGNYTTTFYNVRKEGVNLQNVASRTIAISNSQSQVKYLGLNPEFGGVTELDINAANLVSIVEEQLMFSYEDIFVGDYFEDADRYGWNIELSAVQPKVKFDGNKSVNITDLYFDVTLDDGSGLYTYTSVVKVNARIKAK